MKDESERCGRKSGAQRRRVVGKRNEIIAAYDISIKYRSRSRSSLFEKRCVCRTTRRKATRYSVTRVRCKGSVLKLCPPEYRELRFCAPEERIAFSYSTNRLYVLESSTRFGTLPSSPLLLPPHILFLFVYFPSLARVIVAERCDSRATKDRPAFSVQLFMSQFDR